MPIAGNLRDHLYSRLYAGRYPPDRSNDGLLLAYRMDGGQFPVIYSSVNQKAPLGAANSVGRLLEGKPALFLLFFTWAAHGRRTLRRTVQAMAVYRARRPQHKFVLLCNAERERIAYEALGLDAVLCNHNAFVDEALFTPGNATPRFDAIHNGAMIHWKRHELSRLVGSCVQITYRRPDLPEDDALARLSWLRREMPSHHFANEIADGHIKAMRSAEVAQILRQARCGLCLSAVEGAMFASMEYLLAGLPVVSTPSLGGRDEFADPAYWLTVDPTPEAVAAGVAEIVARNLPRERVRARVLEKVHAHRRRLRETVSRWTDGQLQLPADLGDPAYRFISNVLPWPRTGELARVLKLETTG